MKKIIKKTLWGVLGLVMMGGLFLAGENRSKAESAPAPSPALIVKSGDYGYEVTSETAKTAALRKVYSYTSEVVIPSTIDGYSIVQIGTYNTPYINSDNSVWLDYDNAAVFAEKDNIVKKLTIPEGVTTICEYAFNEMNSLSKLILPKTLKDIEGYNFMNSAYLKKIKISGNMSVGDRVFDNVAFDEIILNGSLFTGEEEAMYGSAKTVRVNSDKAHVSLGSMKVDEVIIGNKVKEIRLANIRCNNIVLKNPGSKVNIEPDLIETKKLTTVITKNIKCKKDSKKYIYSWKPLKIKGQKCTVNYTVKGRKNNGKFQKIKTLKKNSIKLDKKKQLKIEVSVKFQLKAK